MKHARNISDESVIAQWAENPYFQYFCGYQEFVTVAPCSDNELVYFRKIIGKKGIELTGCDRGYRGVKKIGNVEIVIPATSKKADSVYKRNKMRNPFKKRAGIEPVIGHLKRDLRLGRSFIKGTKGDAIKAMLAAAAFIFKRVLNALFCPFLSFFSIFSFVKTSGLHLPLKLTVF